MHSDLNIAKQRAALPLVTFAVVLLSLLTALWLQDGDRLLEQQAAAEYQRLELGKFELPLFIRYLQQQENQAPVAQLQSIDEGAARATARHWIDISPSFLDAMWSGHYLPIASTEYRRWQERRTRYDSLLQRSVTHRLLFSFDQPGVASWVAYALASDTSNYRWLLGLCFLLIAGVIAERLAGPMVVASTWVTASLGAATITWFFESNRLLTLLGADGATSGVLSLSLLSALLSRRPGLIASVVLLAAAWVGFQVLWPPTTETVWWHIGGASSALLLGILFALLLQSKSEKSRRTADSAAATTPRPAIVDDENAIRSASELVSAGDHQLALRIADEILGRKPDHVNAWQVKLKAILQDGPINDDHPAHAMVEQLALRRDGSEPWNVLATEQFEAYLRATAGKPRISLRAIMALAQRYMAIGKLDSAQRLFSAVERKAPNAPPVKRMRKALLERAAPLP